MSAARREFVAIAFVLSTNNPQAMKILARVSVKDNACQEGLGMSRRMSISLDNVLHAIVHPGQRELITRDLSRSIISEW